MGLEERTQSKTIGDFTYEVTPLPFGVGRKALMRLVKIMSPVLAGAFSGQGNAMSAAAATGASAKAASAAASAASAAGAFGALPDAMTDADLEFFAKTFGDTTRFSSESNPKKLVLTSDNQELHFAGRYLEFAQWLIFCIEVNYKGFFTGMGSLNGGGGIGDLFSPSQTPS